MEKAFNGDFSCFISNSLQIKKDLIHLHTRLELLAMVANVSDESQNPDHPITRAHQHIRNMAELVDRTEEMIQDFFRLIRNGRMTQRKMFELNSQIAKSINTLQVSAARTRGFLSLADDDWEFFAHQKGILITKIRKSSPEHNRLS